MNIQELEKEYPSVELVYPLAIASYETASKRIDSLDGRLQTILAFIVTVSVAALSILSGQDIQFSSIWFYSALCSFVLSIIIGVWARLCGEIQLLDLTNLYEEWLSEPPWQFKKDMIFYAARDYKANMGLARFKWKCSVVITILFVLQAVFQSIWALSSLHHP